MVGRRDDDDLRDGAVVQQLAGDPQRERGLAGPGRGDDHEVLRPRQQVAVERATLPRPECDGGGRGPLGRPREMAAVG